MARKSRKGAAAVEQPKEPVEKVWRAALYIRLSVEFNGKRGDSLETQRQIMEAYLTLCPEIEIAGVYTDNGITGRTFEREAFQRMLHDVEDGKINCIIVKD
ncbi:MAG: recombinase family protein, partial [Oscillospiraceae bacterium]|nr:recombinase family protein [Oscillospiraceae bacterium]